MAIDTYAKRASAVAPLIPCRSGAVVPDVSWGVENRAAVAYLYHFDTDETPGAGGEGFGRQSLSIAIMIGL